MATFVTWVRSLFGKPVQPPDPPDPPAGEHAATAVVAGLVKVDPKYYGGWAGDCPGCDLDAAVFANFCRDRGIPVQSLFDEQVTRTAFVRAVSGAACSLRPDGLLLVFISGHGGQVPDQDSDEADGQDETLCLWDGQLVDDELFRLWAGMPAGIRVLFVTDTCNSGTNFRGMPRSMPKATSAFLGQLIHYGGCADGLSSYGSARGGAWTTALSRAQAKDSTYASWFKDARLLMDRGQVPVYAEYGDVTPEFRDAKIFT